jgi:prophage tail gpP-like protein
MIITSVTIEVDGIRYDGWDNLTVNKSLQTFCGSFSFTTTASDASKQFPIKQRAQVNIYVNDTKVITGYVDKISIWHSGEGYHNINISGRDRTVDLLDSTLGGITFTSPITLKAITERILNFLELDKTIKVIDPYNLPKIKTVSTPKVGSNCHDFLQAYAAQNNVLLTTNNDGNIQFVKAGTERYKTTLSTLKGDSQTIKSGNLVLDDSKRFHLYSLSATTAPINILKDAKLNTDKKKNIDKNTSVIDDKIRPSRKFYFKNDDDISDDQVTIKRVKWEANYRRAQSLKASLVVSGFKPLNDEGIWELNKNVRIIDTALNLNSHLLITRIKFTKSNDDGSETTLTCLTNDAFTAAVNKPNKAIKDNDEGQNYSHLGDPVR